MKRDYIARQLDEIRVDIPGTSTRKVKQVFSERLIDLSPFMVEKIMPGVLLISGETMEGITLPLCLIHLAIQPDGEELIGQATPLIR